MQVGLAAEWPNYPQDANLDKQPLWPLASACFTIRSALYVSLNVFPSRTPFLTLLAVTNMICT